MSDGTKVKVSHDVKLVILAALRDGLGVLVIKDLMERSFFLKGERQLRQLYIPHFVL